MTIGPGRIRSPMLEVTNTTNSWYMNVFNRERDTGTIPNNTTQIHVFLIKLTYWTYRDVRTYANSNYDLMTEKNSAWMAHVKYAEVAIWINKEWWNAMNLTFQHNEIRLLKKLIKCKCLECNWLRETESQVCTIPIVWISRRMAYAKHENTCSSKQT